MIDGDTLELAIDVGFRVTVRTPVRLYGIDAPEMSTKAGKAAARFTTAWVDERLGAVVARTYKSPEKFGRWLVVIADIGDAILNDELVANGHAVPYSGGPRGVTDGD